MGDDARATLPQRFLEHWRDPLFRNGMFLVFSQGVNALFAGVFWLLAARRAATSEAGLAVGWISAVGVVALVGLWGLGTALIRFLPETPPERRGALLDAVWLWTSVATVLAGSLAIAVGVFTAHPLVLRSPTSLALFLLASVAVALTVQVEAGLAAYRAAHVALAAHALTGAARVTLVIALPSSTFLSLFLAWAAPVVIMALVLLVILPRFQAGYRPFSTPSLRLPPGMVRYATLHHVSLASFALGVFAMPALVVAGLGPAEGAFYYIAFAAATALYAVPNALARSAVVEGSWNPANLARILRRTLAASLGLGSLGAIFLAGFATPILSLFGPDYAAFAKPAVLILAFATPLVTLRTTTEALLLVSRQMRSVLVLNGLVAAAYVGLALMLGVFGPFGIQGVAGAWFLAHLAGAVYSAFSLPRWRQPGPNAPRAAALPIAEPQV